MRLQAHFMSISFKIISGGRSGSIFPTGSAPTPKGNNFLIMFLKTHMNSNKLGVQDAPL